MFNLTHPGVHNDPEGKLPRASLVNGRSGTTKYYMKKLVKQNWSIMGYVLFNNSHTNYFG